MNIRYDDIPTVEGAGRLGRQTLADPHVADAYRVARPSLGGDISSLGLAAGLRAVRFLQERLFPSGSQIVAMGGGMPGPNYTTYMDCTIYYGTSYDGTCNEACFGFAPHHMDPFYCATCDEQAADPINNPPWHWHFTGARGAIQYKDMEPDACNGRDAWKWKVGACGNCETSAVFRCHDGYKKYPNSTYWDPTICQGLVSCDNKLTLCD